MPARAQLRPSCLLEIPQCLKHAVSRQQVLGRVILHDMAILQQQDLVEVSNGLEAMRNDDSRPVAEAGADELIDESLGLSIKTVSQRICQLGCRMHVAQDNKKKNKKKTKKSLVG